MTIQGELCSYGPELLKIPMVWQNFLNNIGPIFSLNVQAIVQALYEIF